MSSRKKLFLIDAYALIFRGYYAFIKNPRINSKGMDTSAIMGFMNSLLDLIKREAPDNLAVAFDKGGSSDRLKIFNDYNANIEKMETEINNAPISGSPLFSLHATLKISKITKKLYVVTQQLQKAQPY